ncbi:MAG: hypothetical protein ACLSAF_07735 [Intestinimonas sp.]
MMGGALRRPGVAAIWYRPPSAPCPARGDGAGPGPHRPQVTVRPAVGKTIDVALTLTLEGSLTWEARAPRRRGRPPGLRRRAGPGAGRTPPASPCA